MTDQKTLLTDFITMFLHETIWRASAPSRHHLPEIDVEADNTNDAAKVASDVFFRRFGVKGIDQFTINVEKKKKENGMIQAKPNVWPADLSDNNTGEMAQSFDDDPNFLLPGGEWTIIFDYPMLTEIRKKIFVPTDGYNLLELCKEIVRHMFEIFEAHEDDVTRDPTRTEMWGHGISELTIHGINADTATHEIRLEIDS